jgi:hypothetical protein
MWNEKTVRVVDPAGALRSNSGNAASFSSEAVTCAC